MIHDYGVARVRPATPEDADALAPLLCAADRQEVEALTDIPLRDVLLTGIKDSTACFCVELPSGEPVALFGVAPSLDPLLGAVWLLGSDHLHTIRLTFLRHSKHWLAELTKHFPLVGNYVDERNALHVGWLRWLGFRFLRRTPLGRNGEVFLEFVRLRE
jgi:hypothetical protein